MVFWCLQFLPKNERKQVNLRYHSTKVEFVCSFFGRIVGLKKSLRLCLTFNGLSIYDKILQILNVRSFTFFLSFCDKIWIKGKVLLSHISPFATLLQHLGHCIFNKSPWFCHRPLKNKRYELNNLKDFFFFSDRWPTISNICSFDIHSFLKLHQTFPTSPWWHQLKYLVFIRWKTLFQKWMDFRKWKNLCVLVFFSPEFLIAIIEKSHFSMLFLLSFSTWPLFFCTYFATEIDMYDKGIVS